MRNPVSQTSLVPKVPPPYPWHGSSRTEKEKRRHRDGTRQKTDGAIFPLYWGVCDTERRLHVPTREPRVTAFRRGFPEAKEGRAFDNPGKNCTLLLEVFPNFAFRQRLYSEYIPSPSLRSRNTSIIVCDSADRQSARDAATQCMGVDIRRLSRPRLADSRRRRGRAVSYADHWLRFWPGRLVEPKSMGAQ